MNSYYYVFQACDNFNKQTNKIDPVKTENGNIEQDCSLEEDVLNTINNIPFVKQDEQENQYHHDNKNYIEQNSIQ